MKIGDWQSLLVFLSILSIQDIWCLTVFVSNCSAWTLLNPWLILILYFQWRNHICHTTMEMAWDWLSLYSLENSQMVTRRVYQMPVLFGMRICIILSVFLVFINIKIAILKCRMHSYRTIILGNCGTLSKHVYIICNVLSICAMKKLRYKETKNH